MAAGWIWKVRSAQKVGDDAARERGAVEVVDAGAPALERTGPARIFRTEAGVGYGLECP